MLKLTAVIAVLTFGSAPSSARATSDQEASPSEATARPASFVSKTVIEEVPPARRTSRANSTPITLNPADWPRISPPETFLLDAQSMASIPTWPTHYEVSKGVKGSYAASYITDVHPGGAAPATADKPVVWGPDVVPVVEVIPTKPSPSRPLR